MNSAIYLEMRREYTEYLVDCLSPLIYEGLNNIYKTAMTLAREAGKIESTLTVYQECLQNIREWSEKKVVTETNRFRQVCGGVSQTQNRSTQTPRAGDHCVLDNLVKAVIKSNILLLCHSNEISSDIARLFYDNLRTETLVHQCYIECGREIHNQPFLFYLDPSAGKVDYMRNQVIVMRKIQDGIMRATRKIMPLNLILKEFLINTHDIFAEPVKVELVNAEPSRRSYEPARNIDNQRAPIDVVKEKTESQETDLDAQIREIMAENEDMGREHKVEELMALEKLIQTPIRIPEVPSSRTGKSDSASHKSLARDSDRRNVQSGKRATGRDNIYEGVLSGRGGKERRDFDNQETAEENSQASEISFGQGVLGASHSYRQPSRISAQESEKIDPKQARFIERYGVQLGGRR
jgi:hypothetical protein